MPAKAGIQGQELGPRLRGDERTGAHAAFAAGFARVSSRIMSEAFSPIITQAALVLPETTVGMIDASATRRPSKPRRRRRSSTTAVTSEPMRQVEVGWNTVVPFCRANSRYLHRSAHSAPG